MLTVRVRPEILRRIDADVARQHELKMLRPTVVALFQDVRGHILLTQSAYGPWGFPQGGIEKGEGVVAALMRELREEVGFDETDIREVARYLLGESLMIPKARDGFTDGKMYHYFHVLAVGTPLVRMQESEVIAYEWFEREEAQEALLTRVSSEEKRRQMLTVLRLL